jgi:hypothetical protein
VRRRPGAAPAAAGQAGERGPGRLSVRNVVPTLTSNKRRGLSLWSMLSNKRHGVLSWFRPRGRTSSSGVLKALYCSAPGVPVVGLLQARRERKRGFQVPGVVAEDTVGESESKCVVRLVSCWALLFVCCVLCLVPCPFSLSCLPRQGGSSSFYRPRKERITCAPRYLAT